jgi:hypothetical protein
LGREIGDSAARVAINAGLFPDFLQFWRVIPDFTYLLDSSYPVRCTYGFSTQDCRRMRSFFVCGEAAKGREGLWTIESSMP